MKYFDKGRVILNIAELPYKCPVAPIEYIFMADWFFDEKGVRVRQRHRKVVQLALDAAVIGQQQQPFGIDVEPSDANHPGHVLGQLVIDGGAALFLFAI